MALPGIGAVELSEVVHEQPPSATYWKVAAITAVAAALRWYRLDEQSLWHDEAISVIVARAPLDHILDHFRVGSGRLPTEHNPPLYALVLHGWFEAFGVGGFQARLLSAVAGVLSVPLIFSLGARLFGSSAGLYAAFLLAISQLGVMFSQEARNYELFLLLVLATTNLYLIAMTQNSGRAWYLGTVAAILMVLTNYYGVFVILALACCTVLYWRSISLWWLGGAVAAGGLVLLPWFRFALSAQVQAVSDRVQPEYFAIGLGSMVGAINRFNNGAVAGLLQSTPAWTILVGGTLFGGPIAWLAWSWRTASDRDRRATMFALVVCAVPLVSVILLGFLLNVQFNIRYVAFCIALYYVLVGAGVARLPNRTLRRLALLAIAGYSGYALMANYRVPYKENYRDAIGLVASQAAEGDCYAFVPFGGPPLEWSIYATSSAVPRLRVDDAAGSELAASCERIWVITYERLMMEAHRKWRDRIAAMSSSFSKRLERRFFWMKVERYDRLP